MKRAIAIVFVLTACGPDPAPQYSRGSYTPCPDSFGGTVLSAGPCPPVATPIPTSVADAGAMAPSTPAPAPVNDLPPPKPTSIPLARTGDSALDALLAVGDKAYEDGDMTRAITAYEAAKKSAPKKAAPIVGVARSKVQKASPSFDFASAEKNPEVLAAIKDLKRASEMDATSGAAQVELGRAYLLAGDAANAEASLRKGARLLPDEPEAHSTLGIALLALGHPDEAATELAKARDLDPGSAARRGNLGTVLFMRGKVAEAIKEYEIQVRLTPDDARAHSDLGTGLLAQSDFTRALPELRKAIELDPKRATFHSNMGYALQLSGKLSDAIAEYRTALNLDPKLSSAWINLATALSRDPKTRGEARQALKSAEKLDPSDPRVKANLEELDALEKGSATKP